MNYAENHFVPFLEKFNFYFTWDQSIFLLSGLVFFLFSLLFQLNKRENISILFLALTAFFLFSFAALLDPFLNLYDERFHALVAKNMMDHPFKPTLYDDPVINMAYDRWDRYHIWLHKQPLFLWQIALCFKIFGVSEYSLRLPDIILGIGVVLAGYRTGKILFGERVGYLTALFIISSIYNIELIAGRQMLEHNDFSFMAYNSLSIWALTEYHYSGKRKWIYFIGLFSGFAILCKWLAGLLVYFGWFVLKALNKNFKLRENKDILLSLCITILIALPWQLFTIIRYPVESSMAQYYNFQHIIIPLDGHAGTIWYHFEKINLLFGNIAIFLITPAFIISFRRMPDRKFPLSLISMVIFTYLFFSLVQTKMPSFPVIVSLPVFVALAGLVDFCIDFFNRIMKKQWLNIVGTTAMILLVFFVRFDINKLHAKHSIAMKENSHSRMLLHNKQILKSLELPGNAVIFNVKGQHYIESMFYTGLPSYQMIPSLDQCLDLISKGRAIAIFRPSGISLPDYIVNNKSVIIIEHELQGYK
jgi:4-amino-4-deoxy-L-arabinose transferase